MQAVAYCRIRYTAGGDFGRAERQRTVLEQMVAKLDGASLSELNDLVDAVFDDIGTNLTMTQIISMATSMKDYQLAGTAGFPFAKRTGNFGSQGSRVVPCTLESNVKYLHAYLFGNEDAQLSDELVKISDDIVNFTGYTQDDALDYGF